MLGFRAEHILSVLNHHDVPIRRQPLIQVVEALLKGIPVSAKPREELERCGKLIQIRAWVVLILLPRTRRTQSIRSGRA